MTPARMMRDALLLVLPQLEYERECLILCGSKLRRRPGGGVEAISHTLDAETAELVRKYDHLIGTVRAALDETTADADPRTAQADTVLAQVRAEVLRAQAKHRPMSSPHEGYAVIAEEVDELWDDVKADRGRQATAMTEAIQIAAMGVRYVVDICAMNSGDGSNRP